eukprot:gene34574-44691_t
MDSRSTMSAKDNLDSIKLEQIGAENVVGIENCDVLQCIEILDGYSKGYEDDINQADKMGQAMVVRVKSANLLDPNKGQATKIGNELYGRMIHEGVSNMIQLGGKAVMAVVMSNFNVSAHLEELRGKILEYTTLINTEKAKLPEFLKPEKAEVELFDYEKQMELEFSEKFDIRQKMKTGVFSGTRSKSSEYLRVIENDKESSINVSGQFRDMPVYTHLQTWISEVYMAAQKLENRDCDSNKEEKHGGKFDNRNKQFSFKSYSQPLNYNRNSRGVNQSNGTEIAASTSERFPRDGPDAALEYDRLVSREDNVWFTDSNSGVIPRIIVLYATMVYVPSVTLLDIRLTTVDKNRLVGRWQELSPGQPDSGVEGIVKDCKEILRH